MTASGPEEDALMSRVVQRDAAALETLYDRYAPAVAGLGWKILGDRAAVEDLVQEAFWRVWTRADSYRAERGRFASWLFGIVHHLAVDHLRRMAGQEARTGLDPAEERPDPEVDVAGAAARQSEGAAVREALEALPQDQRRLIELAYFGGLTRMEIAQTLKIPVGTVHTRARLGLLKLRAELETRGYLDEGRRS